MNKKSGASINIGASSILVIFVLLCLTTFSTLSMLSANADLRLTKKAEAASDNYWAANNKAQETVGRVDAILSAVLAASGSEDDYLASSAFEIISEGLGDVEYLMASGEHGFSLQFTIPVDASQELFVELAIEYSQAHYRITSWVTRSTVNWDEFEDSLDLWGGEDLIELPAIQ